LKIFLAKGDKMLEEKRNIKKFDKEAMLVPVQCSSVKILPVNNGGGKKRKNVKLSLLEYGFPAESITNDGEDLIITIDSKENVEAVRNMTIELLNECNFSRIDEEKGIFNVSWRLKGAFPEFNKRILYMYFERDDKIEGKEYYHDENGYKYCKYNGKWHNCSFDGDIENKIDEDIIVNIIEDKPKNTIDSFIDMHRVDTNKGESLKLCDVYRLLERIKGGMSWQKKRH